MRAKQPSAKQKIKADDPIRALKAHRIEEMSSAIPCRRKKKIPSENNRNHIDWRDPRHYGYTRLHKAASKGDFQKVKELVSKGARLDMLANGGSCAAQTAFDEDHEEIAKYLADEMDKRKILRRKRHRR